MDLKKIIKGKYESLFYCKMYNKTGEGINQKNCELLGFKDGIPVIINPTTVEINSKPSTDPGKVVSPQQTLRVEVNAKTGEKFVNFNGKKLKMVPESELPSYFKQNGQVIKATPGSTCTDKKPLKIKIIGSMPSVLYNSTKLVKNDLSRVTDNNNLKTNVNKTDNSGNIQISHKTILIKESNPTLAKIPSVGKVITGNSAVVSGYIVNSVVKSKTCGNLSQENDCLNSKPNPTNTSNLVLKSPNGVLLKMNPLDLSKVNKRTESIKSEIKKLDKSVETTNPQTVDVGIQTDEEEMLLNLINGGFWDFVTSNTPIEPPTITNDTMNPMAPDMVSNPPQPAAHSERFIRFFEDIRSALIPDNNGNMPIHVGVLNDDISFVKKCCNILKVLRKSVDILNHGDFTALQLSVLNNCNPQIVKTLLMYGASLHVLDSEGNNILHLAIECKRTEMLDIILRFADQRHFNLDDFNAEGLTPLMISCSNGLLQCADLLLKYDADVNVRDRKSGRTALFHAAENHNFEMVQLLLNNNADTKIKNFFGTSPHDAMYEVDDVPDQIKSAILGKSSKRKNVEDPKQVFKVQRTEEGMNKLKTYARYKKIDNSDFHANFRAMAKYLILVLHLLHVYNEKLIRKIVLENSENNNPVKTIQKIDLVSPKIEKDIELVEES